jgi:hypothetical protein
MILFQIIYFFYYQFAIQKHLLLFLEYLFMVL